MISGIIHDFSSTVPSLEALTVSCSSVTVTLISSRPKAAKQPAFEASPSRKDQLDRPYAWPNTLVQVELLQLVSEALQNVLAELCTGGTCLQTESDRAGR